MRWDFNGSWEGVVTRGPRKGTRMICKVSSLTAEKWAIVSKTRGYIVAFENASYADKKSAALHLLQDHLLVAETRGYLIKEFERPQLRRGLFYLRPQWGRVSWGRGRQGTGAAVFQIQ